MTELIDCPITITSAVQAAPEGTQSAGLRILGSAFRFGSLFSFYGH